MIFDWKFALSTMPDLLKGLVVTVEVVICGMTLALVLGLLWTLCRRSANVVISWPVFIIVEFLRSTPLLIQAYFLFYVLPEQGVVLSPFITGAIALGLHYSAYTSEVYRAGIEAVPSGQWEAAAALNFNFSHTFVRVILPQAIPKIIPALGNYLIAMFKEVPILSAITLVELLQIAKVIGSETFRYLEPLTLVGLLFLLVSLISSRFINQLESMLTIHHT